MSNVKKGAAEELGGPLGKARIKKKSCFDVVLFKGSRTARADAFALPLRASSCACGWPRPAVRTRAFECHRPIGLPATFLEVTRETPSSHPRVASSRVGPGRRRLALARARLPLGSPNDGAPSGRVATFAAGLLLSRRCVVRLTRRQDPEVAYLEVFASPATYPSRAVLVRGCRPSGLSRFDVSLGRLHFTQIVPASLRPCGFCRRRAQASHPGSF